MKFKLTLLFIILGYFIPQAQETFPKNGVEESFEPIYAFTNAHIIISPDSEIKNGTLIIQGGKILAVDTNINLPNNVIVNNLNGDYIYPSFIDLYSNYGLKKKKKKKRKSRSPQYKSTKNGAYHWNEAIHPEINAVYNFKANYEQAKEYLNQGFGSVLTHDQDGIFRGTGCFTLLSNKNIHENILQEQSASFYSFKKGSSRQRYPTSLMGSIALIKQTLLDAEWYESQNQQKNLSYFNYNNQKDLPQIFAINDALDYNRVYQISDEFEIDFIIKGNGKEYKRITEVKNTDFPVIIPVNFPKAYDVSDPESTEWLTLSQLKDWETSPYNPVILANNNIKFCITSSDLKNKKDFLTNIRLAIKKGLKKSDALAALTTNPASIINMSKKIGTLEKGKIANFFIASKDIFENGEIYENWSNGEKHVINKKISYKLEGHYTFNSNEYSNRQAKIQGDKKNIKITLPFIDSIPLITKINNSSIKFSVKNGTFRAIGKINNTSIKGRYQNQEGKFFDFTMIKDSTLINNLEEKNWLNNLDVSQEDIDKNTLTQIPSVWLPNKAHGFINLPEKKSVLFKNTTVWTNEEEGILLNTDVLISNGKIVAIGSLLNPKDHLSEKEYLIIDASEMHLTSGIIDEHSHIAISKGVNESSQAVTAEVSIENVINPEDHNIYRQIAGGTVAAQLLHGSANPIGGQSAIVKLRWGSSAEKMKIKGADKFIKFALGENVKQSNWGDFEKIRFPQTRMGVEQVFYDAFYRAKKYESDWIKYNQLSLKEKRKISAPREDLELNVLVEILNSERFITCHSYVQSEINMLMHVADSMNFTINTFTHILEGYKVAEKMKQHGAGGSTFSDWWAYKFEVNDAIPYNATLLNDAGVITAINSDDAEMGRRLNQEAAKAVKYGGCSEEEAWKMVTLNPAKLLHLDKEMGSVAIGKDADIVLWTENPLSIYSKVIQTYIDGILMYDKDNDEKMRERDLKERMRIIQLMSENKNKNKLTPTPPTEEKLYKCCQH